MGARSQGAGARVCFEAGWRMSTNIRARDLDLAARNVLDGRRLEIVAEGFPLFGGTQIAVDATLVSPLHCNGSARGQRVEKPATCWPPQPR